MPSCSTPRRAFAHGLELGGDLLQRAIGRRRLDAGDQPDQPVIAELRPRAVQQGRLDNAFVANRRTVRRSRSTVQWAAWPRFKTRTTSPQG